MYDLNAWREVLAENESDHSARMESESCQHCGVTLCDHYDIYGNWKPCNVVSPKD